MKLSSLRLTRSSLATYLNPKYQIYLPSWASLRDKVDVIAKGRGCGGCKKNNGAWREFLVWYKDNEQAIKELKAM